MSQNADFDSKIQIKLSNFASEKSFPGCLEVRGTFNDEFYVVEQNMLQHVVNTHLKTSLILTDFEMRELKVQKYKLISGF